MSVAHSVALFLMAGLCEIGGGYLVWQCWRNGAKWSIGLIGAIILTLYGIIPTYQAANFGRVYAAYGSWLSSCQSSGAGQLIIPLRIFMTWRVAYFAWLE